MGEIAEALRRAREQVSKRPLALDLEPARAVAAPTPMPSPRMPRGPAPRSPAASPAPSSPAANLESVAPWNAAVILEGPEAEACRHLALRLREALHERNARSLAVVSAERSDGKTTVACDLAVALAAISPERDVALVDFDLRRPSVRRSLALPSGSGVEQILTGEVGIDAVRIAIEEPPIDVFPSVTAQRNAHKLILRPETGAFLEELERRYAYVIVDTPPAPLVPDARLLLRHTGACAAVVRAGKTRMRSVRKLVECLPREKLLGWILNGDRSAAFGYEDYYYYGDPSSVSDRERAAR